MHALLQVLRQFVRRLFRPNQQPSPKVQPKKIHSHKQVGKQSKQHQEPAAERHDSPKESFWRDKIKADATDEKRDFYAKYRHRLENQDRDISPKH